MTHITTFANMADASIAEGMLESHDIHCQLIDNTFAAYPTPAINGGVQLFVDDSKVDEAFQLLKTHNDID